MIRYNATGGSRGNGSGSSGENGKGGVRILGVPLWTIVIGIIAIAAVALYLTMSAAPSSAGA